MVKPVSVLFADVKKKTPSKKINEFTSFHRWKKNLKWKKKKKILH